MTYFQWFIKEGWKRYAIPFLLGALISTAMILNREELIEAPKVILFLSIVTIMGFDIGIVTHSIMTWKASQTPPAI